MVDQPLIENSRRAILYVCRHYVPACSAAGVRAGHFVDALLGQGLRVIVLTVGQRASFEKSSDRLTIFRIGERGELPGEIGELKAGGRHWSWLRVVPGPDADRRCVRGVEEAGQWLIDTFQVRLLVVSGPPFYLMAVGERLAGENELEFVLEFRDAWVGGMYWPYRNGLQRASARRWERRCVEKADKIITVTDAHRKILIEEYGQEVGLKTSTIRHGFEVVGNAWGIAPPYKTQSSKQTRDRFVIAYTGQLRGIDIVSQGRVSRVLHSIGHLVLRVVMGARFCERLELDWMSPHRVMRALGQVILEKPEWADRVELVFAGERFEEIDRWAKEMGLVGCVRQLGPLSPVEANRLSMEADLLVLSLYGIKDAEYHWCVPSKLYQYLATGNPILALVPAGEARDLVLQAGTGLVAEPDCVSAMAKEISRVLVDRENGKETVKCDWSFVRQFELAIQQKKFTDLIEAILEKYNHCTVKEW
ncbi:MAG: glycosyltransferase [Planctomycetes bacterium]|nr:glycosyltransferase [Planctomycetota bacterium]